MYHRNLDNQTPPVENQTGLNDEEQKKGLNFIYDVYGNTFHHEEFPFEIVITYRNLFLSI